MPDKSFSSELTKILARPDADELQHVLEVYREWGRHKDREHYPAECGVVMESPHDDPEKAFAFLILAASRYDDPDFLGLMAAGVLEDLLQEPTYSMLERILDEARKAPRIRWMLAIVYPHALSDPAVREKVVEVTRGWTGDEPLPPKIWA